MKRTALAFAAQVLSMFPKESILSAAATLLAASVAFAQGPGNFSIATLNTACQLNTTSGILAPGCFDPDDPNPNGTVCATLGAPIKVSNGQGLVLLVTPSMVTGLFTDTKISATIPSASADVGIEVCVQLLDGNNAVVNGAVYGGDENGCAIYDQRFQSISSQLFSTLSQCALSTTTQGCTTNADCANLGDTSFCEITNPGATPPTGVCATANPLCNFELVLSTLSAHSFNFAVVPPTNGTFTVSAAWHIIGVSTVPSRGAATVAACAGPGTLTVLQGKVFQNSGSLGVAP